MSLLSAVLQEAEKATFEEFKQYRNDLYPKIIELTDKVQMLYWSIQQNIIDLYLHYTTTKSLEQLNYKNRKAAITSAFEKLSVDLKEVLVKLEVKDEEFTTSWTKLCKLFSDLNNLSVAAEARRELYSADHEFRRYKYSDAMLRVINLQKQLKVLTLEGDLAKAVKNMRSQADNQLSIYAAQVSMEWEDLFRWSEQKSLYYLTYSLSVQQNDSVLMKSILGTLHSTKRLNDELTEFSDFFLNKLLHNLIRHTCNIYTDDKQGAIIFTIKIDLCDKSKPNFQTIFNNLTAVFEFLQSTLSGHFETDEKFVEILSESIRMEFFNKIIDDCIKNVLPTCVDSYEHYKNIVSELDSFNKFLIELKFVEADDSPLNVYMDTEGVLYKKRFDKLLADVRIIMKESLSYGTIPVGCSDEMENETILNETDGDQWDIISKPHFLPKCVVSQNVKKILTMILEHLEECVKMPEKFCNQLLVYIKDIAVMYQWLVPKQFKVNLECCPLDIALFFNNCFYLAHGLLGPSWRNMLPLQLADHLNTLLVECIHDLRVLGLEKMSLYLQKQKDTFTQTICQKEPTTAWNYETYKEFNSAIVQALSEIKDLKCSWYNVLPSKMYGMSMCTLVQALCQSMLDRLLRNMESIAENIILLIRKTFNNVLTEVELLFEEPIDLDEKINNWCKFKEMSNLLRAQLLEISKLWNHDKTLPQLFTCDEIRKIIKIRFPDDNIRLKILAEIQ